MVNMGGKAWGMVEMKGERRKEGKQEEGGYWVEVMQNFCTVVNVL
jgi:hypothetical protein